MSAISICRQGRAQKFGNTDAIYYVTRINPALVLIYSQIILGTVKDYPFFITSLHLIFYLVHLVYF